MKPVFIFILLYLFVTNAFSAEHCDLLTKSQIVKINDRIYTFIAPVELPNRANRGYMSNSTFIIGEEGVILIDTGFSNEIGENIKKCIARITEKPVTHIFNTHDHGDHILGNSAFESVTISSSKLCQEKMEKSGYEWLGILENLTASKYPDTRPVIANQAYHANSHTDVTLQGIELQIWVPKKSHTDNDLMIYLPKDNVLVTGDIMVNLMIPSFRDAYIGNWIVTLQEIISLNPTYIVPGHGPLMTTADAKQMRHRIQKLYKDIEQGYEKELMDSEIRQVMDLSEWKKLKYFNALMGINISRTYLEVQSEDFK